MSVDRWKAIMSPRTLECLLWLRLLLTILVWGFFSLSNKIFFFFFLTLLWITCEAGGQTKPFFKFIFLLKDNCFIEFCCFLSNLSMNQPSAYIYPLPFDPHLPIPPLKVDTEPLFEFPEPYRKFPLAIYLTYGTKTFQDSILLASFMP